MSTICKEENWLTWGEITALYLLPKGLSHSLVCQASGRATVGSQFTQGEAFSRICSAAWNDAQVRVDPTTGQKASEETQQHPGEPPGVFLSQSTWEEIPGVFQTHSASGALHMQLLLHRILFLQITLWFTFPLPPVLCSDVTLSASAFLTTQNKLAPHFPP